MLPRPITLLQQRTLRKGVGKQHAAVYGAKYLFQELPIRLAFEHNQLRNSLGHGLTALDLLKKHEALTKQLHTITDPKQVCNMLHAWLGEFHHDVLSIEAELAHQGQQAERLMDRIDRLSIGIRVLLEEYRTYIIEEQPSHIHYWSLKEIVELAASDVSALSVEKFGTHPEIIIDCDHEVSPLCVDYHVHYVAVELLKNSIKAVIDRVGAAQVEDSQPIVVTISCDRHRAGLRVLDNGGGIPDVDIAFRRFYSFSAASTPATEPSYMYSRDFGVPFSGLGVGLPRSRVYCQYGGGNLELQSLPGHGTSALATFGMHGSTLDFVLP